jgi:hypothetical protein
MQNTILISILVGALAGIGGAFLTQTLLSPPSSPADESVSGMAPEREDGTDALTLQLAELKRENEGLAYRLSALENLSTDSGRQELPTSDSAELAELQKQVVRLATALDNPTSVEAVSLRNAVGVALEDIRSSEEEDRQQEQEEREVRRMDERMERLKKDLGLDDSRPRRCGSFSTARPRGARSCSPPCAMGRWIEATCGARGVRSATRPRPR